VTNPKQVAFVQKVAPGLQQAAADAFDKMVLPERENEAVKND